MDLIGGRWKSRIICVLADGPLRYSELRAELVDITDTALASVLKDLTGNQLVARRQYEGIPPRVEYELTKKGRNTTSTAKHSTCLRLHFRPLVSTACDACIHLEALVSTANTPSGT